MIQREELIQLGELRAVAVGDRDRASVIVVLLHGFGMTPADLSPFAHSLGIPAWFLFPEGPREASIGGRAWWHIDAVRREEALAKGPRDFADEYPPDLPEARVALTSCLDAISPAQGGRPLIVGGFSQGGMLACDTLLRTPCSVAGMALLSASRIAFGEWTSLLQAGAMRGARVLVSHGEADRELRFGAGVALSDCLRAAGAQVTWVPFEQGHEIPLVVWRSLRKFFDICSRRP